MAGKKIVFIVVEGPTDEEALGVFLSRIYDKHRVYVHIYRGDVTTQAFASPAAAAKKIARLAEDFARSYHFSRSDFKEIVQIADMDGAFVPKEAVVEDDGLRSAKYSLTEIRHPNPQNIIARNENKSRTLTWLSETKEIWGLPYHIYYMSSNLDHVLYDQLNCSNDEKESNAYAFAKKYREDLEGFVDFICDSDFSVNGEYEATWNYIKKDLRSLERHTNLSVCIKNERKAKDA